MNLGRNQLLAWVNETMQCQYTSVEMLADGIAFSQILDAVHPGSINIFRIEFQTRYPSDCLRNLRILESALKKLRINQPVSFQKMSQGKFQDNINFLQWIYGHSMKNGRQNLQVYQAYNRRLQILQRQGKSIQQVNPHLIPNQAYLQYEYDQQNQNQENYQEQYQPNQANLIQRKEQLAYRIEQVKQDCNGLQGQMKTQMETNWKLMHNTERSIQDRNTLYSLLKQIQTIIKQSPTTSVGSEILSIISEDPQDFN